MLSTDLKTAFVFPGQGSQHLGMLSDWAKRSPLIESTFAEASEVLGEDLWRLTQEGPESRLNQTQYTQPALLAAGVALFRVTQALYPDQQIAVMAGHSLGEYTALVCAGALDFKTAIELVYHRGRFMQAAVPEGQGKMAAILGLNDDLVAEACKEASQGDIVSPANYNTIGQVVIAGEADAVERATTLAKAKGAKKAVILPVSVPSHCALMAPASLHLAEKLRKTVLRSPTVPVIHNVDLQFHETATAIQDALIHQLVKPVRWVETIQLMTTLGVERLVECGPGKVLSALAKRIAPTLEIVSLSECKEEACL